VNLTKSDKTLLATAHGTLNGDEISGERMPENLDQSRTSSDMTAKEKEETAAITGATALGCLGVMTLPFSAIAVIILVLVIVCAFIRIVHHL